MPDKKSGEDKTRPESETELSFDPTKVQDLAKDGREQVDQKETEE